MILNVSDAAAIIELGEDQEDVLNEVSSPCLSFLVATR